MRDWPLMIPMTGENTIANKAIITIGRAFHIIELIGEPFKASFQIPEDNLVLFPSSTSDSAIDIRIQKNKDVIKMVSIVK